jgi:hypothetical protein
MSRQPNGDQIVDFLFRHGQPSWSGRGPTVKFRPGTPLSTVSMTRLRNITQLGMTA